MSFVHDGDDNSTAASVPPPAQPPPAQTASTSYRLLGYSPTPSPTPTARHETPLPTTNLGTGPLFFLMFSTEYDTKCARFFR